MFPLKNRKLIRGCEAHKKAGLGCGADYRADHIELYAPFDGVGTWTWGDEGGWWYKLTRENGDRIEMAHNSKLVKKGQVKEGELIAITGNTGKITTGAHLHIQILKPLRIDPETYDWGQPKEKIMLKDTNAYWLGVSDRRYAGLSNLEEAEKTIGLPLKTFRLYTDKFVKEDDGTIYQHVANPEALNEIRGGKEIGYIAIMKKADVEVTIKERNDLIAANNKLGSEVSKYEELIKNLYTKEIVEKMTSEAVRIAIDECEKVIKETKKPTIDVLTKIINWVKGLFGRGKSKW